MNQELLRVVAIGRLARMDGPRAAGTGMFDFGLRWDPVADAIFVDDGGEYGELRCYLHDGAGHWYLPRLAPAAA